MIKYGVMKEYKCKCGMHVVTPGNTTPQALEKRGELLTPSGHTHEWVEVEDGPKES